MAYPHRRRSAAASTPFATWNFHADEEISSSRRLAAELWHLGFDEISAAESPGSANAAKFQSIRSISAAEAIVNHARRRVKELESKNRSLRRKVNRLCKCDVAAAVMARRCAEERRGRVEAEAACAELFRRISRRKAEADSLRTDFAELAEEHRALQLAEAWREERVQMKLADARLALEDGFAKINFLVSELRSLIGSGEFTAARELLQSAAVAFGEEKGEDEVCGWSEEWEGDKSERRHNVSPASAVVAGDRKVGSPEKRRVLENPHIARGMSGCVKWPRGRSVSKSVVKAKILNLNQRLNSKRA